MMDIVYIIEIIEKEPIFNATPILLSECMRPRRLVIRQDVERQQFQVHVEMFTVEVVPDGNRRFIRCTHDFYADGQYVSYGARYNRTEEQARVRATEVLRERYGYTF